MENCSYAVQIGTEKLGYSLVGINGANIFEMDRTRTLAILWQLMRSYMTKVLSSMNGEIRDTGILKLNYIFIKLLLNVYYLFKVFPRNPAMVQRNAQSTWKNFERRIFQR